MYPQKTVACTAMYHLVPPCTNLYHGSDGTTTTLYHLEQSRCRYKAVHTGSHQYVLPSELLMSVLTGMYHFEVSRTALYPLAYVLAHTGTYHLVLPYTRGHGDTVQDSRCQQFQVTSVYVHCWMMYVDLKKCMYPFQRGMSAAQTVTCRYANNEYHHDDVTNLSVPVCTWYTHVYAGQNVYIHVYTCTYTYEQCRYMFILAYVCTMYVLHVSSHLCTISELYVHVHTVTFTEMYVHVWGGYAAKH